MEAFSALLAFCAGNSPVTGEFPAQRPVTRSFDVFFDLRLNQRLSKQSWGWWLRRDRANCDVIVMYRDFAYSHIKGFIYHCFNTMRPRQNVHYFANDIFKRDFLYENCCILILISRRSVSGGPIDTNPALVQIMVWCRSGDKPLSSTMMASFTDAYMRYSASFKSI